MKSSVWVVILFSAFVLGAEAEPFNPPSLRSCAVNLSTIQPFNSYTNHAGNAISGWPVKLTATHVTLAEPSNSTTNQLFNHSTFQPFNSSIELPLSIFPESERRRIAADFTLRQGGGQVDLLRIPVAVKRAITGAEKAIARSRRRAEKGLCTKEESDAFCEKSEAALRNYLDKQVKEGVITTDERKALGR